MNGGTMKAELWRGLVGGLLLGWFILWYLPRRWRAQILRRAPNAGLPRSM
jgi:hypothetical protein